MLIKLGLAILTLIVGLILFYWVMLKGAPWEDELEDLDGEFGVNNDNSDRHRDL